MNPPYHRDYVRDYDRRMRMSDRDYRRGGGRSRSEYYDRDDDRGFLDRASDEVRSWFGDDEARRRRRMDERDFGPGSFSRRDYDRGDEFGREYDRPRGSERGLESAYGRDYGRGLDFDRDYGRRDRESYGSRDYGRRDFGDRDFAGSDYDRGAYGRRDYENRGMYGDDSTYGDRDRYSDRGMGGRDVGRATDEGWPQGDYRGFAREGDRDYGRGDGRSGYGSDFGPDAGTAYTYTEYWLIPGPMSGRGPEGYERSGDRIEEDVCERLSSHGRLDASNIRTQVDGDEVTLEGTVQSRRDKREAENVAESVAGVRDVHNRLTIQEQRPSERQETTASTAGSDSGSETSGPTSQRSGGRSRSTSDGTTSGTTSKSKPKADANGS